jgi:hypothetical protein
VALLIGMLGIVVFIGVGEALNNAVAAFAAVSLPFALIAGLLAWLSPRAQWPVAVAISAPVALLCVMGSQMGAIYLPGGMWTVLCAVGGAYVGARWGRSRVKESDLPPK